MIQPAPSQEDADLLQQLHAADACSPPPPGHAINSQRLLHRLRQRRRRALELAAGLLLTSLAIWELVRTPAAAAIVAGTARTAAGITTSGIDAQHHSELDQISSRIDQLLADLADPIPAASLTSEQLRYELADARASALASWQRPASTEVSSSNTPKKDIR